MDKESQSQGVPKKFLNRVMPLGIFTAVVLFVMTAFTGGWVGYHYAKTTIVEPEKPILNDASDGLNGDISKMETLDQGKDPSTGSKQGRVISKKEFNPQTFTCDHTFLNELNVYSYADWPVYKAADFGVSFSYPSGQTPNYEERLKDTDGREHLRLGYVPRLAPEADKFSGKESFSDINDSWEVEIYRGTGEIKKVDKEYCSQYSWCLLEEVDYRGDLYTYVSSFEDSSIGYPNLREYTIFSDNGLVIRVSSPVATSLDNLPCAAILSVNNLDKIARSVTPS
jgi:hypothetical protein